MIFVFFRTLLGMKKTTFQTYFYLFFIASVIGYLWEVFLYLALHHRFVNRGFFYGPWLPVYGMGAVLLEVLLQKLPIRLRFIQFLLCASTCTATEYLLGIYLTWRRSLRYWDYSMFPFNLNGYVCLYSFLAFGIAGMALHYLLVPWLQRFGEKPPSQASRALWLLLVIWFVSDFIYSCYAPNTGADISFSTWRYLLP